MDVVPYQPREAETIKSVTLADLEFGRPRPFDRIAGLAKMALMLWGALSFGAAAGTAAYYYAGATGEPVLVAQRSAAEAPVAAPERDVALAEIPPHLSDYVGAKGEETLAPAPIVEARLPRPRPDEPIFTGSIERPRTARSRYVDPCEALQAIGARFVFGARCRRETRYYAPPPPPRYYYPAPYQRPYVVR